MKSQQDSSRPNAEPGVETDALRLSDIAGRDSAAQDSAALDGTDLPENEPFAEEEEALMPDQGNRTGRIIMVLAVAGIAAAAVIGAKIAYDRHKSASGYQKAVAHLEDAREAIMSAAGEHFEEARDAIKSAAGELPERSRAVLHKVTHR